MYPRRGREIESELRRGGWLSFEPFLLCYFLDLNCPSPKLLFDFRKSSFGEDTWRRRRSLLLSVGDLFQDPHRYQILWIMKSWLEDLRTPLDMTGSHWSELKWLLDICKTLLDVPATSGCIWRCPVSLQLQGCHPQVLKSIHYNIVHGCWAYG